jgi:hypothetical protein
MTLEQSKKWTIKPTSSLFDLKINEVIDYRDLLWYKSDSIKIWFYFIKIFRIY